MIQPKKERVQEDQANMFAVALLLPTAMFVPEWNKLRRNTDNPITEEQAITKIAKKFEVPEFAVTMKLMYLSEYGDSN